MDVSKVMMQFLFLLLILLRTSLFSLSCCVLDCNKKSINNIVKHITKDIITIPKLSGYMSVWVEHLEVHSLIVLLL